MEKLSSWSPQMLSVLRIVTGLLFVEHGTQKLLGFPAGQMAGSPVDLSLMGMSGVLELVVGTLILIGLFTRQVAFILSGEMAFAYFIEHAPSSFFPILNDGTLAVLFCFVFLYMATAGGGPWSLDAMRARSA